MTAHGSHMRPARRPSQARARTPVWWPSRGPADGPRAARGFTLVEMVVVIALIGLLAGIAMPQLMPALVFSRLEGAARHLAGFGRSAVAQASLMRETLRIQVDFDAKQYWIERLAAKTGSLFDEKKKDGDEKADAVPAEDILDLMHRTDEPSEEEVAASVDLMRDRFEQFVRAQLASRAKQVEHEGILDEIGPLFDKPFSLDNEDDAWEEVKEPLLERTQLPDGVVLESLWVGGKEHSGGQVEIELTALGLAEPVVFHLTNEDGDYFTVTWDAITGVTRIERGKKPPEQAKGGAA